MDVKKRKNAVSPAIWLAGLAVLFLMIISVKKDLQASETTVGDMVKQSMAQELSESVIDNFLPIFSFVQQSERRSAGVLEEQLSEIIPIYGYSLEMEEELSDEAMSENYLSLEDILLAEAQEGNVSMPTESELPKEHQGSMYSEAEDSLQELLRAENEAAIFNMEETKVFVRHTLQNHVDLQELRSYEELVKIFYTIDKNTMAGSEQLDVSKLMSKDMTISKENEEPQILIYHTHSQEGFADSIPGDEETTIVGVGAHLSDILSKEYGYNVLHHKGQYDVESRDDAYSCALPEIERILEENPTIQVVIDLHRDSMPEETKLVMDLDGRSTARFMFFNGLSRTQKTGNIAYLYNENQADNLAFSFQMQLKAMEYYPGLTRKIYLKGYRYNMHLRPRTTLIELGAQNNTVEEAMNACDPLAHIIDMVLSGES